MPDPRPAPIAYPQTRKGDVVDDYHGEKIPDPYRWLEDLDAPETRAWIEAQNRVTFGWLGAIPARERIRARLSALWNYEKRTVPFEEGGRTFWYRNDGLQPQPVLFTAASVDSPGRVLLDPNTLSADGTVALGGIAVSRDGKYLAWGSSSRGSDWHEWRVREIETGRDLEDHLQWIRFAHPSWTADGKGFFYSRYREPQPGAAMEEPNYYQKLYYHRLGTPQSEDALIYERPDKKGWGFAGVVTDDGRYLVIAVWKGSEPRNLILYKDLQAEEAPIVPLIGDFDAQYGVVDNDGPVFWLHTNLSAPRGRLVELDLCRPDRKNWKELIPEQPETLVGVGMVGDRFIADYLKDSRSAVRIHARDGSFVREMELPGLGNAGGFSGKRRDRETFFTFTNATEPPAVWRHDMESGRTSPLWPVKVDFDSKAFETRQVFIASRDGTKIPMFLSHRKDLAPGAAHPTYLYGYGGFNVPVTSSFTPAAAAWMEMGGVYATANLRGGGEYGEEWHQAGTKLRKQNVFDDFIACAEWLVGSGLTTRDKLAIGGRSNGGLLVGACVTQRPELFGAAFATVGVMDMLRFHKFTIGWAWQADYGTSDDPAEFRALRAYSPLHNIRPGTHYPPFLICTGDHDDRVVPAHSYKFAAAMQAAQAGNAPVLIRIDVRTGHGMGKPTAKLIDEAADAWAFLARALGMP
ncbi:MAG: S9 family peptidase [Planctomycetes bacterium]|nr:S9 family peptidase [Planctomycetota bacterium]